MIDGNSSTWYELLTNPDNWMQVDMKELHTIGMVSKQNGHSFNYTHFLKFHMDRKEINNFDCMTKS